MNDDANMEQRRARLRAMRERYQQDPLNPAETAAAVNPPIADGQRRQEGRRVRAQRVTEKAEREPAAGGLLQRLARFLAEPSLGDSLVDGAQISEQRLRQVVRWLEQRSKTAQGAAGERIQRLLRFLTQDIPGEPRVAGVNLKRLQQVLERADQASVPTAPDALAEPPPQVAAIELPSPQPSPVTQQTVAAALPRSTEPVKVGGEIAVMEETLRRLRELTDDLELRLREARRQGESTPEHAGSQPPAARSQPGLSPSEPHNPRQTGSEPSPAVSRSKDDEWFAEFLE